MIAGTFSENRDGFGIFPAPFIDGSAAMRHHRFWPPRFGLRALLLIVLAAAVVSAGFESRRRTQHARDARAEFERLMEGWKLGVVSGG